MEAGRQLAAALAAAPADEARAQAEAFLAAHGGDDAALAAVLDALPEGAAIAEDVAWDLVAALTTYCPGASAAADALLARVCAAAPPREMVMPVLGALAGCEAGGAAWLRLAAAAVHLLLQAPRALAAHGDAVLDLVAAATRQAAAEGGDVASLVAAVVPRVLQPLAERVASARQQVLEERDADVLRRTGRHVRLCGLNMLAALADLEDTAAAAPVVALLATLSANLFEVLRAAHGRRTAARAAGTIDDDEDDLLSSDDETDPAPMPDDADPEFLFVDQ